MTGRKTLITEKSLGPKKHKVRLGMLKAEKRIFVYLSLFRSINIEQALLSSSDEKISYNYLCKQKINLWVFSALKNKFLTDKESHNFWNLIYCSSFFFF